MSIRSLSMYLPGVECGRPRPQQGAAKRGWFGFAACLALRSSLRPVRAHSGDKLNPRLRLTRWLLVVAFTHGLSAWGHAASETRFEHGVEAYQTGQFAEAAEAFRDSVSQRPASGTLVNLGITEWRRGRSGAAIVAWEQALWVDVFNTRAQNNLRFARELGGLDAPRLAWYETASTWLPTNSWAWIAGTGLWLALGMVTLPVALRWRRAGWHQPLAALGLGVLLLSLPACFGVVTRAKIGFVLDRKTPLRLTPTEEADTLATLPAGEPARLLRVQGDYAYIRTHNGVGWIERDKFGLVCPR